MNRPAPASSSHRMAKLSAVIFLLIALACGGLAAFIAHDLASAKFTGSEVVPVVVARHELRAGEPLEVNDLVAIDWPANARPAGSYASVDALFEANPKANPVSGIVAGEPILSSRLADTDRGTGVAVLVRPSMRAMALEVHDSVGHTGMVYPGAMVDVIATVREGGRARSFTAATARRVLSVGMEADVEAHAQTAQRRASKKRGRRERLFVTLEVTPQEAEELNKARVGGKLDVVVRNPGDDSVAASTTATAPVDEPAKTTDADDGDEVAKADKDKDKRRKRRRARRRSRSRSRTATTFNNPYAGSSSREIETYNAQ